MCYCLDGCDGTSHAHYDSGQHYSLNHQGGLQKTANANGVMCGEMPCCTPKASVEMKCFRIFWWCASVACIAGGIGVKMHNVMTSNSSDSDSGDVAMIALLATGAASGAIATISQCWNSFTCCRSGYHEV